MRITKMHGTGNDFVILEGEALPESPAFAQAICDRHRGIGADGVLLIHLETRRYSVFNADGSRATMCGNGLRCAARWVHRETGLTEFEFISDVGPVQTLVEGENVCVGMPTPSPLGPFRGFPLEERRHVFVSFGNPHLVLESTDPESDLRTYGRCLAHHPAFSDGMNVHFVNQLNMVTWERGAGPTMACGSGACAVAYALLKWGEIDGEVTLNLPGGQLTVNPKNESSWTLSGPARFVFESEFPYAF